MAQATTYDPSGINLEQVHGVWQYVENENYPLSAAIPKKKGRGDYEEFLFDTIGTVTNDAYEESEDSANYQNLLTNRARVGNYRQELRELWAVGAVEEDISKANGTPASSSAKVDSIKIALRRLKRQIEVTLTGAQAQQAPSAANKGKGITGGFWDWIDSAGPSYLDADYRTPAASIDADGDSSLPTRTQALAVWESMYNENGSLDGIIGFCGSTLRRTISGYAFDVSSGSTNTQTTTLTSNLEAKARTLTLAVDIIETELGRIKIRTHSWMNAATSPGTVTQDQNKGIFINPAKCVIATLRDIRLREHADNDGGPRGSASTIINLGPGVPQAWGKMDD